MVPLASGGVIQEPGEALDDLWEQVNDDFTWELYCRGKAGWVQVEGLKVVKEFPEPFIQKITLVFDAPYNGDYRIFLKSRREPEKSLDLHSKNQYRLEFKEYRLTYDYSDLKQLKDTYTSKGLTSRKFWFSVSKYNIKAGEHIELDPSFIIEGSQISVYPSSVFLSNGTYITCIHGEDEEDTIHDAFYTSSDGGVPWTREFDPWDDKSEKDTEFTCDSTELIHGISQKYTDQGLYYWNFNLTGDTEDNPMPDEHQFTSEIDTVHDIALDENDSLHVVYAPSGGNLNYTYSDDQGQNWSTPVVLSNNFDPQKRIILLVDKSNNLHLISCNDTGANYELVYLNSTDNGASWNSWITIDSNGNDPYLFDASIHLEEVHVLYSIEDSDDNVYHSSTLDSFNSSSDTVKDCQSDYSYQGVILEANSSALVMLRSVSSNIKLTTSTDNGTNWSADVQVVSGRYINNNLGEWGRGTVWPTENRYTDQLDFLLVNKPYYSKMYFMRYPIVYPYYSDVTYSTARKGYNCTFSCKWMEDKGSLHKYIFSWNGSGAWVNDTAVSFTDGSESWANVSKTLPSSGTVGFRWYANSTHGYWNNTGGALGVEANTFTVDESYYYDFYGPYYENSTRNGSTLVVAQRQTGQDLFTLNGHHEYNSAVDPEFFYFNVSDSYDYRYFYTVENYEQFYCFKPDTLNFSRWTFTLQDFTGKYQPGETYLESIANINGTSHILERDLIQNEEAHLLLEHYKCYVLRVRWSDDTFTYFYVCTGDGSDTDEDLEASTTEWEDEGHWVNQYVQANALRPNGSSITVEYLDTTPEYSTENITFIISYRNLTQVHVLQSLDSNSYSDSWNGANSSIDYVVDLYAQHEYWGQIRERWILDASRSFTAFPDLDAFGSWGGMPSGNLFALLIAAVLMGTCSFISAPLAPFLAMVALSSLNYLGGASFTGVEITLGWVISFVLALALVRGGNK